MSMSLANCVRLAVDQLLAPDFGEEVLIGIIKGVRWGGWSHNPGVLQRDHVVNVDIRGGGPGSAIVGGSPGSRCGAAGIVGHDVGTVPLEDILASDDMLVWDTAMLVKRMKEVIPGVAGAASRLPVRELLTAVGAVVIRGLDSEGS
jgi:hypothetical protein